MSRIMSMHWNHNTICVFSATSVLIVLALLLLLSSPIGRKKWKYPYINQIAENRFENKTYLKNDWIVGYDKDTIPVILGTEFVKPKKVEKSSLNVYDLLYESEGNSRKKELFPAFHVTGNFRNKSYKVWDPHPEYIVNAFGHNLRLILHQDESFIRPHKQKVLKVLNNYTEIQEDDDNYMEFQEDEDNYLACFYKGYVQGDIESAVAVSLCEGMTGHIKTFFGSLLIQPVENFKDNYILHKIWKHLKPIVNFFNPDDLNLSFGQKKYASKVLRKKRNFVDKQVFTMEVLVAVDKSMSEFHSTDLKSYIFTLISIVSSIFSDASIGNSINISVPNVLILKEDINTSRDQKNISASQLLKHFCSFLKKKGIHYDTAIMITRDQICRNERETRCDTLGLAELGTVCKRYSCSIVQDNGLPAAFTIAHELGHILNMPHDDDNRCSDFKQYGKNKLHIMSSTMGDDIHPWSWSDCSRHYVSEFLEKEDTSCLEDFPQNNFPNSDRKQPGELYTLDQQCRLIHGNHSKHCIIDEECKRLWCKADRYHSNCRSSNLPWADGTPCGTKNSWCQKGRCFPKEGSKKIAINGEWGPWNAFTPCSMTCGGGVQESHRECNNPLPQNGGKYCSGSRKKYRSCNTQNCPKGSLDSREQQCYDMNGNNFGLRGIDSSVRWIPKYGLLGRDKCKLYCRWDATSAYFQLADKVRDGTTCSFDSFDKCVNGICRPAGCDNELNSIATLDKCGVCEGKNNTCEEYSGNFYKSDLFNKSNSMYYYVATIPKGSSNILITQPGYHTQNYIVLRNSNKDSLLNGDRVINLYRYVFFYAGVSFEYNGSNSTVERVNSTYSRKLKKDLIMEIISLNSESIKNDTILLSFSYTAEKPLKETAYQWELRDWSQCDALCQGTSFQLAECVNTITGLIVSPPFCDFSKKPPSQYRTCNMDCILQLNISSISECSASCGNFGKREKNYYCIQTYINTSRANVVDLSFCEPKFDINRYEDCREGCWNYSDWSPCSQTCGSAQQTRLIACYLNNTEVNDSLCDIRKKEMLTERFRSCSLRPCNNWTTNDPEIRKNHFWIAKEWGPCDINCEKSRSVSCLFGYDCQKEKKPLEKKKCCAIKYVPTWSACSAECGAGIKRKEFVCSKVYNSEKKGNRRYRESIDKKLCADIRVPTPKRSTKNCKTNCKWVMDNWSTCPSDCKIEIQIRTVNCTTDTNRQVSRKHCESLQKPMTKQICSHCVRREYKITKCNCDGYRKRRVVCSDKNGKHMLCPNKPKDQKEKCRPPLECFPKSCADIKLSNKILHDREYTIFVRQKPKKIYCHNMRSKPKEYITLNPFENYSIYYDNKTKYPNLCPPESRKFEYKDHRIPFGRTKFHKVGINISNLRVRENDFTFAESFGSHQLFGSAGDCYSRNKKCPQGNFSISFKTTGFTISPKSNWETFGNRAVIKTINEVDVSTHRRMFCGGYCGRCQISARVGLVLEA